MAIALLIQAMYFEKLQAERLALGQHPIECGLVGQHADQHRVRAPGMGLKRGKGGADRLTQAAADADLVAALLLTAVRAGHVTAVHEVAARLVRRALAMASLMMSLPVLPESRCQLGPGQGEQPIARSG
jgi:hypothetical protein